MRFVLLAFAAVAAGLVMGCQETVVPSPSVTESPAEIPAVLINHNLGPDDPHDTAGLRGQLFERNRCLWIREAPGSEFVPLWPPGYRLSAQGDSVLLISDAGRPVGELGAPIHVGGGIAPANALQELVPDGIPPQCFGAEYWVVSGILR